MPKKLLCAINNCEQIDLKYFKDPKAFIDYSNDTKNVSEKTQKTQNNDCI